MVESGEFGVCEEFTWFEEGIGQGLGLGGRGRKEFEGGFVKGKWGCEREISANGFGCGDYVEAVMILWV